MQQFARNICALLLSLGIFMTWLPDGLLDFFHNHEHVHCEPSAPGEYHWEGEHVHCSMPDWYMPYAEMRMEDVNSFRAIWTELIICLQSSYCVKPWLDCQGRAPPTHA